MAPVSPKRRVEGETPWAGASPTFLAVYRGLGDAADIEDMGEREQEEPAFDAFRGVIPGLARQASMDEVHSRWVSHLLAGSRHDLNRMN